MEKPIFPQKQINSKRQLSWIIYSKLLSATPGRNTKAHSKNNSVFLRKLRSRDSCFLGVLSQALRIPLHDSILGPCSDHPGFDREVAPSIPTVTLRMAKHNLPKLHRALPKRKLTMPHHAFFLIKMSLPRKGTL